MWRMLSECWMFCGRQFSSRQALCGQRRQRMLESFLFSSLHFHEGRGRLASCRCCEHLPQWIWKVCEWFTGLGEILPAWILCTFSLRWIVTYRSVNQSQNCGTTHLRHEPTLANAYGGARHVLLPFLALTPPSLEGRELLGQGRWIEAPVFDGIRND